MLRTAWCPLNESHVIQDACQFPCARSNQMLCSFPHWKHQYHIYSMYKRSVYCRLQNPHTTKKISILHFYMKNVHNTVFNNNKKNKNPNSRFGHFRETVWTGIFCTSSVRETFLFLSTLLSCKVSLFYLTENTDPDLPKKHQLKSRY